MPHSDLHYAAVALLLKDQRETLDLDSHDFFDCYPMLRERYTAVVQAQPGSAD